MDGNRIDYEFTVSAKLEKFFSTTKLTIEYDREISGIPESVLAIPFVGSLIAFSWITDCNFWVREIDHTFYEAVPRIRQAYQEIYDHYPLRGRFAPAILTKNKFEALNQNNHAMLLFSGGADCQATYIRNITKSPVLCNIQGFYKTLSDINEAAEADIRDINEFAKQQGLQTCIVKSNFAQVVDSSVFDKIYKKRIGDTWWHGFLHSMAFISIAIPIAFKEGIEEIMIASSLTTGLSFYCASNLTTDSEFAFAESGYTTHDGFELNRQDKMRIIVSHQQETGKPYFIRVCSFNDHNCCECEKCFRTILGIVAEGGNIVDFGFNIKGSLAKHWESVIYHKGGLMSFRSEKFIHWPHIKKRMQENRDNIKDKEFVDWFLSFDFDKAKREGLRRYYRQNFFPILKRKLHI